MNLLDRSLELGNAWATLAQGSPPSGGGLFSLLPMLVIFAIFYFLVLAPVRKKQKVLQQQVDALQRGDKVITNGGLHGEVATVDDAVVILKVTDSVKLKVSKSAIATVLSVEEKGSKS